MLEASRGSDHDHKPSTLLRLQSCRYHRQLCAVIRRCLINSISLEKKNLKSCFQLLKKYGAMFILPALSDAGLPKDINEKKEIIHTILARALELGMQKRRIL